MNTACLEDSTLKDLIELIVDQLHLSENQVVPNTLLIELDMDSIDTIEVAIRVHEVFGIEISNGLLDVISKDEYMTVRKLFNLIKELNTGDK